jgi:hypothetical protein
MFQTVRAEIVFSNSADVDPAIAELIACDFKVEILDDQYNDYAPAACVLVWTLTNDDSYDFLERVDAFVEPLGGVVMEDGHPVRRAWRFDERAAAITDSILHAECALDLAPPDLRLRLKLFTRDELADHAQQVMAEYGGGNG